MLGKDAFDQACDWIIRLDSGTATASDRSEFVRWLNRKPDHAIAYEEMSQIWARLGTLGLNQDDVQADLQREIPLLPVPWYLSFRGALAASLTAVFLVVVAVLTINPQLNGREIRQFVTGVDQEHRLIASDGSVIRLGKKTAISLEYTQGRRLVRLQYGTVFVDAKHNPKRPFAVSLGGSVVQALGTEFQVSVEEERVFVSVTQGSVSFSSSDEAAKSALHRYSDSNTSAIILNAGQSMSYRISTQLLEVFKTGSEKT